MITTWLTASGTQNTAFFDSVTATNSPTSYNASGLPNGLSVNTATGVITGTPTVAGAFAVNRATNAGGTGSATLSLTIAGVAVAVSPPAIVLISAHRVRHPKHRLLRLHHRDQLAGPAITQPAC